jgi:putative addiction module killer protein
MTSQPREIKNYITSNGKNPFSDWFTSLRDINAKAKIRATLKRVTLGNLGDYKSVGEGVFELRINYASGYRIYFGQIDAKIILLLCGGDKSTQNKDILTAKQYWQDYRRRKND